MRAGKSRTGGSAGGRKRTTIPSAKDKLPLPAMPLLRLALAALLVCRHSLAFFIVARPAAAPPGIYGASGVTTITRTVLVCPGGSRRGKRTRGLRRKLSLVFGRSSTSENNVSLADGLTTSSTETQNGGEVVQGSDVHLQSGIFLPAPGSAKSLEAALTRSQHFRDMMCEGVETNRGRQERGLLHDFDPMERVVLTANGNLQRLMSSYYNSPVTVDIKYCREVEPSVYEREVEISIFGRVFCRAKSLVVLHNPACVEAVKTGSVGIGQLFRSLDILPNFELLNAGHWTESTSAFEGNRNDCEHGGAAGGRGRARQGLWRVYDLRSRHVSCRIHEEFLPDLFDLK